MPDNRKKVRLYAHTSGILNVPAKLLIYGDSPYKSRYESSYGEWTALPSQVTRHATATARSDTGDIASASLNKYLAKLARDEHSAVPVLH
mgnify:FL=1